MLFNMGDWQVLVSLMGLFMSLWFVIGSCSDRKMISGHFSIWATYLHIRRLVGSTNQAYSSGFLHENQWNELIFFEFVPSHCFGASEVQT